MDLPEIVSYDEWLVARKELLAREKELFHANDRLNSERRRLPMVRIDKDYRFTGPEGEIGLLDMFDGHQQLVVQHFMFAPSWDQGCGSCTAMAEVMSDGVQRHLHLRDTAFAAVSRAPYPKLQATREAKGWTFPWYSSFGSDFNFDFHVALDPAVTPAEYNFRDAAELEATGFGWLTDYVGEQPGVSAFLRDGDDVFRTYSTFGRGVEVMMAGYRLLDITALGRQETWEEPKGRAPHARPSDPSYSH
jgi:predicted dithiol-disulfide oxidoreductase (DUF899 family)